MKRRGEQQRELNGFALHLRIPAWVRSAKLRLGNRTNGREISLQTLLRGGCGDVSDRLGG